jgi:hypothetical protein
MACIVRAGLGLVAARRHVAPTAGMIARCIDEEPPASFIRARSDSLEPIGSENDNHVLRYPIQW